MIFWKLTDGVLELAGSTFDGAALLNTTPPAWPWDNDRAAIVEVVPHDAQIVYDPEIDSLVGAFKNCPNLTSINISNMLLQGILYWATGNTGNNGFAMNCPKLNYFKCGILKLDGTQYVTTGANNPNAAFKNSCGSADRLIVDTDLSIVENISGLLYGCSAKEIKFQGKSPEKMKNIGALFASCANLEEIDLRLWKFDETGATFTKYIYTSTVSAFACTNLKELKLPRIPAGSTVGSSNTGLVGGASSNSKYLHLTADFSRLTNADYLFCNFKGQSLIVDGLGLSDRCTSAEGLFYTTNLVALPELKDWDFASVTTLKSMCFNSPNLRIVDLSNWELRSLTNLRNICSTCNRLSVFKIKMPNGLTYGSSDSLLGTCSNSVDKLICEIDCENTTNLDRVFRNSNAKAIELKLTNYENINSIENLFYNCTKLVTIRCDVDLSACAGLSVFNSDALLVGGAGTAFNSGHVDAAYAKLDDGAGYFSSLDSTNWLFIVDPIGSGSITADIFDDNPYSSFLISNTNVDEGVTEFTVKHIDDVINWLGWYEGDQKISTGDQLTFTIPAVGDGTTTVIYARYYIQSVIYPDPWEGGGTSQPSGPSQGSWDESSDYIGEGDMPGLTGVSKFTNIYVVDQTNLDALSVYLWGATFEGFWENIWGSPMDYITSLAIMPIKPELGANEDIKVGKFTCEDAYGAIVNSRWCRVPLGEINIREFTGSYLDYSPFTKAQIFLPFIGYRDLDVDSLQNATLSIIYDIDILTGDLVAKIMTASGGVTAQYQGNCKSELPVTGQDNSKLGSSIMSGIVALAATAAGVPAAGAALAKTGNDLLTSTGDVVQSSKPNVQRGGSLGATGGLLGTQVPYIIWTIPRVSIPADYSADSGLPINARYTLGDLVGYTLCSEVHIPLTGDMTQSEADEIEALLKGGVYL